MAGWSWGNISQAAMGHYPTVGPHCGSLLQAIHCTLVGCVLRGPLRTQNLGCQISKSLPCFVSASHPCWGLGSLGKSLPSPAGGVHFRGHLM